MMLGVTTASAVTGDISTVAGTGSAGHSGDGGPATAAELNAPNHVSFDLDGNMLIADLSNHVIRRVDHVTGTISTIAGTGTPGFSGDGGPATSAEINTPYSAIVDAENDVLIVEFEGNRIREVDHSTGTITTVVGDGEGATEGDGGPATAASVHGPTFVAFDPAGDLAVSEYWGRVVRKVDFPTGTISTIVGTAGTEGYSGDGGPATAATTRGVVGIAYNSAGDLYIADCNNNVIRKVDHLTQVITTVAGTGFPGYDGDGGPATSASLNIPNDLVFDGAENMFIADYSNNAIRKIDSDGVISTVAGTSSAGYSGDGGPATAAELNAPSGLRLRGPDVFVADSGNHVIRRIEGIAVGEEVLPTWTEQFEAGDAPGNANLPTGTGPLGRIKGTLGENDEDLYRVCVTGEFSAESLGTLEGHPPAPNEDPTLYLFDASGVGVVSNDDIGGSPYQSGSRIAGFPVPPGTYYLAIADYDNDPLDAADQEIFPEEPFTGNKGPNPGAGALDHWDGNDASSANGAYAIVLTGVELCGAPVPGGPVANFDGNGTTDVSVFRGDNTAFWFPQGQSPTNWGTHGDIPVPGYYDFDNRTDVAVFRPSAGVWLVRNSAGGQQGAAWGTNGDIPVAGDYDGDGDDEFAVFRPSNGFWFVQDGPTEHYGLQGDIPVPADYDGDGDDDIAVFRPSSGSWFVKDVGGAVFGTGGDIPVPADYDGDGDAEFAVFRPTSGLWFVQDGPTAHYGTDGDIPVPADYDGDGDDDIAVFRPSDGFWFVEGGPVTAWGVEGDVPLPVRPAVWMLAFGGPVDDGIQCGELLTQDTTLTADLGPCPGEALIIGADDITLDLDGHHVFGTPDEADFAGIRVMQRHGVTVRGTASADPAERGTVSDFAAGVMVVGGSGNTIENLIVRDNTGPNSEEANLGDGIVLFDSPGNRIVNNLVARNGYYDNIGVLGHLSDNNVVQNNVVEESRRGDSPAFGQGIVVNAYIGPEGGGGPDAGKPIENVDVLDNTIRNNDLAGINTLNMADSEIARNVVQGNGHASQGAGGDGNGNGNGIGVRIGLGSTFEAQRNSIHDNQVLDNRHHGIHLQASSGSGQNQVVNNDVRRNGLDGIRQWDSSPTSDPRQEIRDNTSLENRRLDLYDNECNPGNVFTGNTFNAAEPGCVSLVDNTQVLAEHLYWELPGDAGDTLATAEVPVGTGQPLTTLKGAFEGPVVNAADADLYKICVTGQFSAATAFVHGSENPALYLFDASGRPVVMNDDVSEELYFGQQAAIPSTSLAAGTYYLGISTWDDDPRDAADNEIFPDAPLVGAKGPNPSVGPLDHWDHNRIVQPWNAAGLYVIDLTGAEFCP